MNKKTITHEDLIKAGYTATELLRDTEFKNGFTVHGRERLGEFRDYCENDEKPLWKIMPLHTYIDPIESRDMTTDKYTFTDTDGVHTIKYNPEEKSLLFRLNAVNNYKGQPHDRATYKWWPHLLINQPHADFPMELRKITGAGADKFFLNIDVRVLDYKDTINREGANSLTFPIFFYLLCDEAPNRKIWFGGCTMIHNDPKRGNEVHWAPDSAGHQFMYCVPMAELFGGMENSFTPERFIYKTGEEWKHIFFDLTPHLDQAIEWANRDNAFGVKVSRENMYFAGGNIGFEIHGNYDCTVEIKNFNLISYRKAQ